jgi:methionyl-tRNA formyltransferase
MRILFFGMHSRFSAAALTALLASRHTVCGVVLLAPPGSQPIAPLPPPDPQRVAIPLAGGYDTPAAVAHAAGIPAFTAGLLRATATRATITALAPDAGCVACFPRRIPATVYSIPPLGCFNIHPALLPRYRGPEPIFWNMRDGTPTGVTIHQIDAGLDTGPIAAQEALAFPDGSDSAAIDTICAARGATLLAEAIDSAAAGALKLHAQPPGGAYYPAPRAADFSIDITWSARRAFNFMRATAVWGIPYAVRGGARSLRLSAALGYAAGNAAAPTPPGGVALQLADGTVYAMKVEG